eukprot:766040-Hanusia_phi.AAC.2
MEDCMAAHRKVQDAAERGAAEEGREKKKVGSFVPVTPTSLRSEKTFFRLQSSVTAHDRSIEIRRERGCTRLNKNFDNRNVWLRWRRCACRASILNTLHLLLHPTLLPFPPDVVPARQVPLAVDGGRPGAAVSDEEALVEAAGAGREGPTAVYGGGEAADKAAGRSERKTAWATLRHGREWKRRKGRGRKREEEEQERESKKGGRKAGYTPLECGSSAAYTVWYPDVCTLKDTVNNQLDVSIVRSMPSKLIRGGGFLST